MLRATVSEYIFSCELREAFRALSIHSKRIAGSYLCASICCSRSMGFASNLRLEAHNKKRRATAARMVPCGGVEDSCTGGLHQECNDSVVPALRCSRPLETGTGGSTRPPPSAPATRSCRAGRGGGQLGVTSWRTDAPRPHSLFAAGCPPFKGRMKFNRPVGWYQAVCAATVVKAPPRPPPRLV